MANNLPYINIYKGDFLRSNVSACSIAAQGLWLRLMILMHDSERVGYLCLNGKAMNPKMAAIKCGLSLDEYEPLLAELIDVSAFSTSKENIIYCPELVTHEQERTKNAERQKRFKEKQKGNGEVTPEVTPKKREGNGEVTRSSFSSSFSSSPSKAKNARAVSVNEDAEKQRDELLEKVRLEYGTVELPKFDRWTTVAEKAINHSLPTPVLLQAYRQIRDDTSRKFDITPENVWEKAMLIFADSNKPSFNILDVSKCPDCEGIGFIEIEGRGKKCNHEKLTPISLNL